MISEIDLECPKCGSDLIPIYASTYACKECGREYKELDLLSVRSDDDDEEAQPLPIYLDETTYDFQGEDDNMTELIKTGTSIPTGPLFPYSMDDLLYWVVKRKTGEVVKYTLTDDPTIQGVGTYPAKQRPIAGSPGTSYSTHGSFGEWCAHYLTEEPVFISGDKRLFICDAAGVRRDKEKVDFVIDGGDVLMDAYASSNKGVLTGDKDLADGLSRYSTLKFDGPRVLKIAWGDRKAPYLHPKFWPELAKRIKGDVITCCQGGHGRSGTSLVCLMMVLNPEYDAKDAIVHLRAIHCPRAIEGADQHKYIDDVATFLGRKANASEIHEVKNFRTEFLAMTKPSAKPYQDRLNNAKKDK